ncbi:cyanophycinase [Brevundimonas sp. 2R-24]|uniref:Cyanophycinase n=1 Tax=Peiella sedimenti TaxID=3061083 RepID=A0ABT8SLY3_9CAUL|nr:cyanophycinase [Caulobacteraceae bacterium XZ-24]
MADEQQDPCPGPLLIIGGHEDKDGERAILKALARLVGERRLVIATVASHEPDGYLEAYQDAFRDLGVTDLVELYVEERGDSARDEALRKLDGAGGVFFTGGDQLRISSQIGDTPLERRILELHAQGLPIAGTSAGAAVMSETMLVKGPNATSYRIGELHMAPGLGLMRDVIIDQHFAERGRYGRLLGAVAHNPRLLGVGIDENTALLVENGCGTVLGEGAVYVVDGHGASHSNIAEEEAERALSIFDVRMHVLSSGDEFDFERRRPKSGKHWDDR